MDLQEILEAIRAVPPWITYTVLFLGAFIEYVFPPVPGDTVVVAGAVLVTAFGWNLWPVLALVTAGAVVGSLVDVWVGRWLVRSGRLARMRPKWRRGIGKVVAGFERHGAVYLAVNRFLPGIRAFFFVAAGVAGLRTGVIVLWSTISALAWNGLLVVAGWALGANLDTLETVLTRYTIAVWIVLGLVLAFVIWKVTRGGDDDDDDEGDAPTVAELTSREIRD